MKNVRGAFSFALILVTALPGYAQKKMPVYPAEQPFWFVLEEGKKSFRAGDYGAALSRFENARAERRRRYTRMEQAFIALLSISEVRRFGDSLDSIEKYIAERSQVDAGAALDELFYRVGRDALHNSAKTALDFFARLKDYAEAEFWIGEIYRLEGENHIALAQYQKALAVYIDAEAQLSRIDLLYQIAAVQQSLQNYQQMEKTLTELLGADRLWSGSGTNDTFARTAMMKTLENAGINGFLTMYRYNDAASEKAHRLLGEFYYKSGRYTLAESHLAFAVLEQNTVIIEEARRKNSEYRFTTLGDLMRETERRAEVKTYRREIEYFRSLYYLGAALYANGKTAPARSIWQFVSIAEDSGEWAGRSRTQLRAPFVEKAVYNP
jgi:tetratricopeptide (TPR) repeat protein